MPFLFPTPTQVIPRDAEQETRQVSRVRRIKPFGIANQRHENLLRHVLGNRGVPAHVQSKAVYRRMLPPVQQREGSLIPGHHPPEQQPVIHGFDNPIHLRLIGRPGATLVTYSGSGPKKFPENASSLTFDLAAGPGLWDRAARAWLLAYEALAAHYRAPSLLRIHSIVASKPLSPSLPQLPNPLLDQTPAVQ